STSIRQPVTSLSGAILARGTSVGAFVTRSVVTGGCPTSTQAAPASSMWRGACKPPLSIPPAMRSAQNRVLGMAGWLLVTYAAAAIGGLASARSGTFYQQLSRPDWAPPPSVFGP